ncbi:Uncharacterised protein [Chromobacterium vaccinii]|nr:Uncharacterised protein [Chromobacterium vaccinii]
MSFLLDFAKPKSLFDFPLCKLLYPMHERKRFRTLGFEIGTVVMVALGSLVMFMPM